MSRPEYRFPAHLVPIHGGSVHPAAYGCQWNGQYNPYGVAGPVWDPPNPQLFDLWVMDQNGAWNQKGGGLRITHREAHPMGIAFRLHT